MTKVYTDGACSGNPGPGGWAFIIPELNVEMSGYCEDTTNNRMEIAACIEALRYLVNLGVDSIELVTDSQYVVNTMTLGWQKKKNQDLWEYLDALVQKMQVKWVWVKGHSSNIYNARCDKLAVKEYQDMKKNS